MCQHLSNNTCKQLAVVICMTRDNFIKHLLGPAWQNEACLQLHHSNIEVLGIVSFKMEVNKYMGPSAQ